MPDVLTLQTTNGADNGWPGGPVAGAIAVATAPPRVRLDESLEEETYSAASGAS